MSKTDRSGEKEFTCTICNKPVDLTQDRYADENGKVMHEHCYVQRLMSSRNDPPNPHHAE
jgi:hypothetical protein